MKIKTNHDPINHPAHYTGHPSGIECIQITEHMGFCLGNAVKYIWRADLKNGLEDLEKAIWYIQREIEKRREAISKTAVQQEIAQMVQEENGTSMFNDLQDYINSSLPSDYDRPA